MIQPAKPGLVTVNIDGKEIAVPKGTNVIEAARLVNVDVPHYCYHPKLTVVGNCRMCLIEMGLPAADPATKATQEQMYCTEVSSWFINFLRPGTVKQSVASGMPVYQVADHMRATDVHGGPLKVLYNGQNRLDVANLDPFPKDR